jgi:hypothetical protein
VNAFNAVLFALLGGVLAAIAWPGRRWDLLPPSTWSSSDW